MKIDTTGSIFRAALRNKSAFAASLIAPAILSTDDRGYFDTAAITTPMIYAGSQMFSSMGRRLNQPVQRIFNTVTNPIDTSVNTNSSMKRLFRGTSASNDTLERALSKYMKRVKKTRPQDFAKEKTALEGLLSQFSTINLDEDLAELLDPGKVGELMQKTISTGIPLDPKQRNPNIYRRLRRIQNNFNDRGEIVGNAFVKAATDSLTPSELTGLPKKYVTAFQQLRSKPTSIIDFNKSLNQVYSTFSDRPEFVRSLKTSLIKARTLKDGPGLIEDPIDVVYKPQHLRRINSGYHPDGLKETYKRIERAQELGIVKEAFETEDGTGMRLLFGKKKSLFIPFKSNVGKGDTNSYILSKVVDHQNNVRDLHDWMSDIILNRTDIKFNALKKEVDSFVSWGNKRPGMSDYASGSQLDYAVAPRLQGIIRSRSSSFSTLPVYPRGKEFLAYNELPTDESTALLLNRLKMGHVPLGPENNMNSFGNMQDVILELLHPFGLHSMDKQESVYRSFSKSVQLQSVTPNFYHNAAYDELLDGEKAPETGMYLSSIAPEHKSPIFNLPDTAEEFQKNRSSIAETFAKLGAGEDFMQHLEGVYERGEQGAFKRLGQLGETEFLLRPDTADTNAVVHKQMYEMDRTYRKPGDLVMKGDVLGYKEEVPVVSRFDGQVYDYWSDANAETGSDEALLSQRMIVDTNLGLHGAKPDVSGVKGQAFINPEHNIVRDLMNALHKSIGDGNYIPEDTHGFVDMSYGINKMDIGHTQTNLLADVIDRLATSDDRDLLNDMELPSMYEVHNNILTAMTTNLSKNRARKVEEIEQLFAVNEQFLADVNQKLLQRYSEAGKLHDTVLNAFAQSGSKDLTEWFGRNLSPVTVRTWNHGMLNRPKAQSLTFDMESFAMLHGHTEAVKELRGRARYYGGGDISQTEDFARHLLNEEGREAEIGKTISIEDIFKAGDKTKASARGALSSPEGRANTIFDHTLEDFKSNFRIDLGEGGQHRYIPVLGNESYGGTSPKFADDKFQTRDYQRKIKEIYTHRNDPAMRDKLAEELHGIYDKSILSGKGSVLRPYSYDPEAVPGFLRTWTDKDDHVVTIGPEIFDTMHRDVKSSLRSGEDVYGMLWRQPISNAKHVRVKYDPNMTGTYGIGASERMYRMFEGDSDEDPVGLSIWKKGSAAHKEAAEAVLGDSFSTYYGIQGIKEDSMRATHTALKTHAEKFEKSINLSKNMEETVANRTAGSAIGVFSNELTTALELMAGNVDIMRDNSRAERLTTIFHKIIRQTPINARKSHSPYGIEQALGDRARIHSAITNTRNEDEAFNLFHGTLLNIAHRFDSETNWTEEAAHLGIPEPEGAYKPNIAYLQSDLGKDDIRSFIRGRTPESLARADLLMGRDRMKNLFEKVSGIGFDEVKGFARGGNSAKTVSEGLGAINKGIADAAKAVKHAVGDTFREFSQKHGKTALLALGAMTALGLMSTGNKRTPLTMPAPNAFRPEETAGIHDHVPGMPMEGSMASNPPLELIRPSSVQHAIVAPINRTTDLSVQMRAKDTRDATEQAKVMSRFASSGHQSVNINIKGDPKIGTLRFREKIRNMREDNG